MATTATKLMTAEEFYDWANQPENRDKYCELERGEIVETPLEGKLHGLVCGNVTWILRNFAANRKKGYVCCNGSGIIVERESDTVRGPDVMLFEDADKVEEVDRKDSERPARLAVEVLSPNDTPGKVMCRVREQLRFGTPLVWVLDPEARNVIAHRPGKEPVIFEESEEITAEDVLPGFRCRVAELFAMPGK